MKQKKLSKNLTAMGAAVTVMAAALFFVVFPVYGKKITADYPEFAGAYIPVLIYLWVMALPVFAAIFEYFRICREIGRDNSFSDITAKCLERISQYAIADTILLFAGALIMLFARLMPLVLLISSIVICVLGFGISVVSAALSHLVLKAKTIKDENDLTI